MESSPLAFGECSPSIKEETSEESLQYVDEKNVPSSDTEMSKNIINATEFKNEAPEKNCNKLSYHNKINKKIFKCQDCGFMTRKIRQMRVHLKVHEPEKPYQCDICKKSFSKSSIMKRHRLSHSTQKHYLCDLCGRSYTQIMSFRYHKLSHMTFLDEKKEASEKSISNVKNGEKTGDDSLKKTFLCDLCGKFFKQAITLKVHKKWHESNSNKAKIDNTKNSVLDKRKTLKKQYNSTKKSFKCSECPFMAIRSRDVLCHMYVHTGKKPYNCHVCKRWFSRPNTLKKHMQLHNNIQSKIDTPVEKEIIITEEVLSLGAITNQEIKSNQISQTVQVEPELADQINSENCDVLINGPKILKTELPKHPTAGKNNNRNLLKIDKEKLNNEKKFTIGKKRYCCDECPYSSQSSRDLKVHKCRHSGEKPYACTVCDKRFSNRSVVKRHLLTVHSEERAHKCAICGKGYTQASNLKMHKLTHYDITTGELITKERTIGRPKEKIIFQTLDEATSCLESIISKTLHSKSPSKITFKKDNKQKSGEKKSFTNEHKMNHEYFYTLKNNKRKVCEENVDKENRMTVTTPEFITKCEIETFEDDNLDNFDLLSNDYFSTENDVEDIKDVSDDESKFEDDKNSIIKLPETNQSSQSELDENKVIKSEPLDNKEVGVEFDETDDLPLIFQKNLGSDLNNTNDDLQINEEYKTMKKLLKKVKRQKKLRKRELKKSRRLQITERKLKMNFTDSSHMLQCKLCHYTVPKKRDLERHMRSHSKEKPFQCDICKRNFSDQSVVKRHKLIHLGIKRFSCQFCDKKFSQSTGLKVHLVSHTGAPPVLPYVCDLCGNTFSQERSLKAHRHVHLRGNYSSQYTCDDCGKSFSFECRLKEHRLTHSGERTIPCDLCDKKFLRVKDMRSHRLLHTREQKSICDICGKFFATPKTLRLHTQCHSTEKPYVCHICGAAFSRQSHLTRHSLTHTGTKTFGCTICDKWFTQRSALNRHKLLHSDETPFSCVVCLKKFKMLDNLKKHVKRTKHHAS